MLIYYLILGIDKNASDEEIRDGYLTRVKRFSPEKHPESFKMITIAYEAIKDKRSRVKTKIFGVKEFADSEDVIRALTLTAEITKRNPTLKEIINIEQEHGNR